MLDRLVRDFHVLRKADFLIGKIWLGVLLHRFALSAFAGLIAVFGLGMANLAGFYALQAPVGTVQAALLVAVVDFAIAGLVLLVASRTQPGPEIELALEVRKMALSSIETDAREVKQMLESVGQDVKHLKANVTQLVHNPLDLAAEKLLIPAAVSLVRGLRSKKEHS